MGKFKSKLYRYEDKLLTACGHDSLVLEAQHERDRLLEWLGDKIERTNADAIAESNNLHRGPG